VLDPDKFGTSLSGSLFVFVHSEDAMVDRPKQTASIKKIEEALTKALSTHRECDGIYVQKITPLEDPGGVSNWDAEFMTEQQGVSLTAEQRRVMLATKLGIQRKLDLAEND
jgi:hypothetical protein